MLISSILTYTKYLNFRCALPSDVFTGEEKKSMAYFFNITYKKDSENSCYWLNKYTKQIKYIVLRRHITWAIQIIFTSDRTLRSHFLYVCMYVRMSHNQIIRLNEKVNFIENLPRIEPRTLGIEAYHAIHWANGISISLSENLAI